jgi:hypothetical protein
MIDVKLKNENQSIKEELGEGAQRPSGLHMQT